jgi:hypothetical protein
MGHMDKSSKLCQWSVTILARGSSWDDGREAMSSCLMDWSESRVVL